MRLPASARWIGLALLGLLIAAAVALAASHLASQQIGIASESITAGDKLAPAVRSASRQASGRRGHPRPPTTTPTTPTTHPGPPPETSTTPAEPTTTTTPPSRSGEPGDDHGHGADD